MTQVLHVAVDSNGDFDKTNFRGTLGWMLGFRSLNYSIPFTTGTVVSITSEAVADLNILKYLYVSVNEYVTSRRNGACSVLGVSLNNTDIIAKVQVNPSDSITIASVEKGNLVTDLRQYHDRTSINRLSVSFVRDNGTLYPLQGLDISMSLFIEA
jgi:hypothetical protein